MKTVYKRIISLFLIMSICFSVVFTNCFMAFATGTGVDTGNTLLNIYNDAVYYAFYEPTGLDDLYVSYLEWCWSDDDTASSAYTSNGIGGSFATTTGTTVTSSGTDYSYVYNDTSTTNYYQTIDTTNNTYYNTYTNTYNTYNDITYNNEYNTYYITEEYYDVYITNNYTYVTYVIEDNTTLSTYYYEIYFKLPDGRNSYTLSAEDIWGEYFIYDVVNYDYVAEDDGTTLGLWHLDEDLKDSSYYGNSNSSASTLIYSDGYYDACWTNSYNGQLSLSLANSGFNVSDDWTLEFLIYVPQTYYSNSSTSGAYSDGLNYSIDNYTYNYALDIIYVNGTYYQVTNSSYQVGSWVRVALVQTSGVLSVFLMVLKVL